MATRGLLLPMAMLHMPSRPAGTQGAASLDTVPRVRYREWGSLCYSVWKYFKGTVQYNVWKDTVILLMPAQNVPLGAQKFQAIQTKSHLYQC